MSHKIKHITIAIDGLKIQLTLTAEQIEFINLAKQAKLNADKSKQIAAQKRKKQFERQHKLDTDKNIAQFIKILLPFGFKKVNTSDWPVKNILAYEQTENSWWAEIWRDCGGEVWLVGKELKSGSFPGGWIYDEAKDVEEELTKALDKIKNSHTHGN